MPNAQPHPEVPIKQLRWRIDPDSLPFTTTDDLKPLQEIMGQKRGVEAFRFAMNIDKPGYNVFVTGAPRTGRLEAVKKLLEELTQLQEEPPDDLCYVNNFKNPKEPILLRFKAGKGSSFKKDIHDFVEAMKREIPELFESQEYINRKKKIMESYEERTKEFFKALDRKVKDTGFVLVALQAPGHQHPEIMPLIDGEPTPLIKLEDMVEKGRFPKEEYDQIKEKYSKLKDEVDQIFLEIRDLQKELQEKGRKIDEMMFKNTAEGHLATIKEKYQEKDVKEYLDAMVGDMGEDLQIFQQQEKGRGLLAGVVGIAGDPFQPYHVNLLVDNSKQKKPPIIIESFPTYRNLFGGFERVVDRSGVWRTDYSKISAGSFVKANGGYLVLNLIDLLIEPGVWPALKRALKAEKMEIQTYDPLYLFTSTGLKPEPIDIDIKVIVLSDPYLYQLLRYYDEDVQKIFKVRADFDQSMNKTDDTIVMFTEFIRAKTEEEKLLPFDRTGAAALIEYAVRKTGRQEKISVSLPELADIMSEADYWAREEGAKAISGKHMDKAIDSRIFRSNMIEEKLQEMINRGSLLIDTSGEVVGQVNGLAALQLGDYMFGRPTRITATTSMGREGVINIEREAKMAGNIHNKGVLILSGYLRRKYAQDKPLSVSASIAFEQSYSGVEGDSASSTELYALLSSLAEAPVKQNIAVTGSVNQKGEVQSIGGVNEKIEGFYDCCKALELTGEQGVMIPASNVADLMLRKDVVKAIEDGKFHLWSVKTIDEGIEILTDIAAGERRDDGSYPEGTINAKVDLKLRQLAEEMHKFGKEEGAGEKENEE